MTRTEKLVTAAVLVVNLTVGFVLVHRSEDSELAPLAPLGPDTAAALSPMPEAPIVTVSGAALVAQR
jgi:hypothetical protein